MLFKLTAGTKNLVDTALFIIGAAFGTGGAGLAVAVSHAPTWIAPFGAVIGAGVGYFISDALTYVDTGVAPTTAQVITQSTDLYSQALPAVKAQVAALPAEQQPIANAILDTIQLEISKLQK